MLTVLNYQTVCRVEVLSGPAGCGRHHLATVVYAVILRLNPKACKSYTLGPNLGATLEQLAFRKQVI